MAISQIAAGEQISVARPKWNALIDAANAQQYATVAAMAAATSGLSAGDIVRVAQGYNSETETFRIVASGTFTANGAEVVTLTVSGVQAVSTRTWFKSPANMLADTRTHTAGTVLRVPGLASYNVVSSGEHLTTAGGVKLTVLHDQERVPVEAFGAAMDGTDDTAAFQLAIDSGYPLTDLGGTPLITDTLLVPLTGLDYVTAGDAVLNTAALTNIRFEPATKKHMFEWASVPGGYVFPRVRIRGLAVRGFGAGGDAVLYLPGAYQPDILIHAYVGFDHLARVVRWIGGTLDGSITTPRVSGVEWVNELGTGSGVTTMTEVKAYIAQGSGVAHYMYENACAAVVLDHPCESLAQAVVQERGNYFTLGKNFYFENIPNVNSGSAFEVGKTGTALSGFQTVITSQAMNLHGLNGATDADWNNTTFMDVDTLDYAQFSGPDFKRFANLFKWTANTGSIAINGGKTLGVAWLTDSASPRTHNPLVMTGFAPSLMQFRGDSFFAEPSLFGEALELFPRANSSVLNRQMFVDLDGRLRYRTRAGGRTGRIGMLTTSALSGWTFGATERIGAGELIQYTPNSTGYPAIFQSNRHSVDTPTSLTNCTTTTGSAVVSKSGTTPFSGILVGDWVTVSSGFPSASTQYQVVAKSTDETTITLDTNATSSVAAAATVATAAHDLIPIAQQGRRTVAAVNPIGVSTPRYDGEEIYCSTSLSLWKAVGTTSADWVLSGERVYVGVATLTPGAIAAGASYQTTITATGALAADFVEVGYGAPDAGLVVSGRVTAADTVTVTITNVSGGSITPTAANCRVLVKKRVVA